jgi:hypothetical protein
MGSTATRRTKWLSYSGDHAVLVGKVAENRSRWQEDSTSSWKEVVNDVTHALRSLKEASSSFSKKRKVGTGHTGKKWWVMVFLLTIISFLCQVSCWCVTFILEVVDFIFDLVIHLAFPHNNVM